MTQLLERTAPHTGPDHDPDVDVPAGTVLGALTTRVIRAWVSIGILVFSIGYAAMRNIEISIAPSPTKDAELPDWFTTYPGGDPWMVGEWLINYGGGFVRRGLFGQLFLDLAPSGRAGLWTLFAIQLIPYLALLAYGIRALHRSRYSWSTIALVCSPAAMPFIAWVPSIDAVFRKEVLSFLVLVLLAWSRSQTMRRGTAVALIVGALPVYILAVFSWEPSALLLPAMLYLLVRPGAGHRELTMLRRSVAAIFVVVAGVGAILSFLIHGDVATADAVCAAVRENGFTGPSVCSGGENASGGAIEAIGWTSYKTRQDLAIALPAYAGFAVLIMLAAIPTLASRWFRKNWLWAAAIVGCVAPLYAIVTDYGRWTHIIAVTLMVCITADGPDGAESRLWNPVSTLIYVVAWGMPHWMGAAQLGGTWWPRVGLLSTVTDLTINRASAQVPVITLNATSGPVELAGRYLAGSPAIGWDSWGPMQSAMTYLRTGGSDLYQDLLFTSGIKFQYFPTSLLFTEPAYVFSPSNIAPLMNAVGWLAVAGTAVVMFLLITHLLSTTRLAPLTSPVATAALVVAGLATLTFRPVMWSWDLGQAQSLINFFCTLSLYSYIKGRRPLSGIALALACLLKPQLGLFALWALLRRDGRFLSWLVGTAAVGVVVSVLRYGLKPHLDYLPVLSFLSQRGEAYYPNQSVNGLLHRALGTSDFVTFDLTRFPPFDATVYAGSMAATLVLTGLALILAHLGRRDSSAPPGSLGSARSGLDFSVALACFTLASPIAWDHHFGVLLPAYALTAILALRLPRRLAIPVLASLALSYALAISELWSHLRPSAAGPLDILYSYILFAVLILIACMLVVRGSLSLDEQGVQSGTETGSTPESPTVTESDAAHSSPSVPERA